MTQSQGEVEPDDAAQYEVEYPYKLKELFEEDNSNDSYELPFERPEDLHAHFIDLEENNLSLIFTWQANEQQTEQRQREFERVKIDKVHEIDTLASTVAENKQRRTRIGEERNALELLTSKGSENLMSESVYEKVTKEISEIRMSIDRKRQKGAN